MSGDDYSTGNSIKDPEVSLRFVKTFIIMSECLKVLLMPLVYTHASLFFEPT